jgi:hypothetical protein
VARWDQPQRPADRHDFIHEHGDIRRARLVHTVTARPGAVILVPLPDIALERRLRVDFELARVDSFTEYLLQRLDQPPMRSPAGETLRSL